MKIGVPKEVHADEQRVALTPETATQIQTLGFDVCIETGAGIAAQFSDDSYRVVGAEVVDDVERLWTTSDIILKVREPENHPTLGIHECDLLREGATLISFIWPAQNKEILDQLADRGATVIGMDTIPRISRAQKLDALSSMANIAGYRAVVEAANNFGRFFTGQITAAGKIPPAKVMVIGAGVAGLAAIGAARRMGAIVRAFDTRAEVRQQVMSMGAEFLELDFEESGSGAGGYAKVMSEEFLKAEMELFAEQAKDVDIIITTALIPGKPSPKLITTEMVKSMKPGSVVVDLAAEQGGNCELTEPGNCILKHNVTIIGYTDLPSRMPAQSSQLYGTNLLHMLEDLTPHKDGVIGVNLDDEVLRGSTVINKGEIIWPPPAPTKPAVADVEPVESKNPSVPVLKARKVGWKSALTLVIGALVLLALGTVAPPAFMGHLTVFVLSCFVGYQVIWNVTPALHTPLMSVTNAISGIIVIGALLQVSNSSSVVVVLAGISVLIATINIAGGFLVTHRMLRMFQKS